ncbi:Bug family tripartite tricarboxylate transporter substrate binding protein [Pseudorhodoferax sp.]|uniref:Bug family tripartite tricarboxylate transporter substrate binding protein n=1 Tax=Pseudorhodoferax sp. TaxID=1993553 RepID=UPI002DD6B89D|nr:tripartite tricarboxylate transporter substrate binding protein [Pseudorhodoferax sp.]
MPALAQSFPQRPLTLVLPYAPGGSADVLGRVLAAEMQRELGQTVVVEYKPGAGGNIGAEWVARQGPSDGHTVLFAASSLATSVSLSKLNFDPRRDLQPVAGLAAIPSLMLVSSDSPFTSVGDVLKAARARPKELTFGSSGLATGSHLAGELFAMQANVELTHVPYRGSGAVYPDLIGQRIQLLFDVMGSSAGHVKGGRVRALATTSARRASDFPEVPTLAESGLPGYEFETWFGLFVPAAVPSPTVTRLEQAALVALRSAPFKERLSQAAATPIPDSASAFGRYFTSDVERWAKLVREGKLAPVQS